MVSNVTVREATRDDIEAIQEVARRSWSAVYDGVFDEEVVDAMLEGGYARSNLEEMVDDEAVGLFVATVDGEVVGYADSDPDGEGDAGQISIYVDPDHWGEGIGTRLLERTERHLADLGVETMRDSVLAANDVGNAFYGEHFEKTGEKELDIAGETHTANVYSGPVG